MTMKNIYLAEAFAQCCMCGKPGLSTTEGDGGTECQLDDGRWTCSHECWDRAIDPTPALGWMAARASAAETVRAILVRDGDHTQARQPECADKMFKYAEELPAAILALPAPTSAQLLAEALKLPEVAALVEGHKEIIRQFGDTPNGHMAATISQSALAAIKDASHANG